MQAAKLKLPPGKYESFVAACKKYNGNVRPVEHKAYDDPYAVDWVEKWDKETLFPVEVSHSSNILTPSALLNLMRVLTGPPCP